MQAARHGVGPAALSERLCKARYGRDAAAIPSQAHHDTLWISIYTNQNPWIYAGPAGGAPRWLRLQRLWSSPAGAQIGFAELRPLSQAGAGMPLFLFACLISLTRTHGLMLCLQEARCGCGGPAALMERL